MGSLSRRGDAEGYSSSPMAYGLSMRASWFRQVNPPGLNSETQSRGACPEVDDFTLPGKTPKENSREPYLKPTQVDEENIQRRSRERLLRNSAN